jgi:cell division septation protein DedD
MHGVFEDGEFEQSRPRRDTEITLTSTTLLGIFFGMVLLCGLFFGLGFAMGRYGPSDNPVIGQQAAAAQSALAAGSKPKPSPTAQITPEPQPQRATVSVPAATPPAPNQSSAEPANGTPYSQQQVRPALPPASYQPAAPPALHVEPATAPAAGLMVQVAAVMHPEDAEVLVGALRKRGYAVSVRRVATDSLIHVQVGPFKSRDEAIRWRQRLLDDGYNAIVQP